MKFKYNNQLFSDVQTVIECFCVQQNHKCETCAIKKFFIGTLSLRECKNLIMYPMALERIIEIVGIEPVEDSQNSVTKDSTKYVLEKEVKDYTLAEVKQQCIDHLTENVNCIGCKFSETICKTLCPQNWTFEGKNRWTDGEISAAKAILELFEYADKIYYNGWLYCEVLSTYTEKALAKIPHYKFPSIKQGEYVLIKDILEG